MLPRGLLYHAANYRDLRDILTYGLQPRGARASRWAKAPSRPDRVYLTRAFPLYFAAAALTQEAQTAAVIEIDGDALDAALLRPDEDAFVQALQVLGLIDESQMRAIASSGDFAGTEHMWPESLAMLGNVAHSGAISRSAFTRVAVVRFTKELYDFALRPIVTMDYVRDHHAELATIAAWLFDGTACDIPDQPLNAAALNDIRARHVTVRSATGLQLADFGV